MPTIAAAEAVALSRRQICLLALVVCVPVPLLSYAAGAVPLPEMLQRAAASFAPFFGAVETSDVRLTRADSSVEPLAIRYLPSQTTGSDAEVAARPAHQRVAGRATASRRRQTIARADDASPQSPGGDTTIAADPNPTPEEPSPQPDAPQAQPPDQPKVGPETPSAPGPAPSTPSSGTPTGHGGGGGAGTGGSGQGSQGGGSGGGSGTPPSTGNGSGGSPPASPPGQGSGGTPPASGDPGSSGGAGGGGNATPGGGEAGSSGGRGGRP
jgi:uncharacterized membrane protein YgcG